MSRAEAPAPAPLRRDEEGPLFAEPWQAQALALATRLQETGHFSAEDWAQALGAEIRRAQAAGDPDDGSTYYAHVLATLERLVTANGLASDEALARRKAAWAQAYRATPHGQPVVLPDDAGRK